MDIGPHNVDAEDLSIAANAFDELAAMVERILNMQHQNLSEDDRRKLIARKIVDAIVRRMSGIDSVEEEAAK